MGQDRESAEEEVGKWASRFAHITDPDTQIKVQPGDRVRPSVLLRMLSRIPSPTIAGRGGESEAFCICASVVKGATTLIESLAKGFGEGVGKAAAGAS